MLRVNVLENGTSVDYNVSSVLAVGAAIAGVTVAANLSGGNVQISVTADVDIVASVVRKNVGVGS